MNVELSATKEIPSLHSDTGTEVVRCDESEAGAFSVYLCDPYAEWLADFAGYNDARNWAEEVAECHECELIDYVEKENTK